MKRRFFFFYILLILAFGLLIFRLFDLMIIGGSHNRQLADGQRIRLRKITASRGIIFDRQGRPLVRNVPVYKECKVPTSPTGGQSARLAAERAKCKVITREEALKLEAQGRESDLVVDVGRKYLYGQAMAHLLGYLGEISEEEIKNARLPAGQAKLKMQNYSLGNLIGRTGIEEEYEKELRGIDGGELIEVDTYGATLRKIGKREPVAGQDLFLSIDASLQQAAYEALKTTKGVYPEGSARGAVVASDPKNGEILVLVSSPSFDPNKLTEEVLNNPNKPMFNRAISGAYPPGSTFKIVTSAAGLEEGKINGETKIEDPGEIVIGSYRFANWFFTRYGRTEGAINLVRAIARSTDTFFYKVGELVGATKLVAWGKAFGLGRASGIDLPGEISGFLPDPTSGEWFLGNTYHLSIGQGNLGLTPLQLNMMTAVIANGGKLCRPKVRVEGQESERVKDCQEVGLKEQTINLITEGMKQACSPGGTAGVFFSFSPRLACKTGTAEFNDPAGRTHAWLTAFSPSEALAKEGAPEIAITALVEAGGEGSTVAAPIVKKVLEEYFR